MSVVGSDVSKIPTPLPRDRRFVTLEDASNYITKLFTLAGEADPQGAARRILDLETKLAEKQWDRARNRDRDLTYNKMSLTQLSALASHVLCRREDKAGSAEPAPLSGLDWTRKVS